MAFVDCHETLGGGDHASTEPEKGLSIKILANKSKTMTTDNSCQQPIAKVQLRQKNKSNEIRPATVKRTTIELLGKKHPLPSEEKFKINYEDQNQPRSGMPNAHWPYQLKPRNNLGHQISSPLISHQ